MTANNTASINSDSSNTMTTNNTASINSESFSSEEDDNIEAVATINDQLVATKPNKQSTSTSKQGKGRPIGSKKWAELEIDCLLDVIEAKLPTGSKHWEEVSMKLYQESGFKRNKSACQQKFFRMADVDKPTGSTFIPRHVSRAKDIKEKIDAAEVVGLVARNDSGTSEDGEEEDDPRGTALKGSRLMDDDGNLRRPKTKKHKANDMADAIAQPSTIATTPGMSRKLAVFAAAFSISATFRFQITSAFGLLIRE
jgi:hypothetical protein